MKRNARVDDIKGLPQDEIHGVTKLVKSRLFSAAPEGTAALFFIQIFATLGFAVLYSTLVLYATGYDRGRFLSILAGCTLFSLG